MIEQTILSYGIGEKIRALRRGKKMGLVELGKHSGLSAALLSKIETGKLIPPLPTLLRIAMVFSVGLDYFFTDDAKDDVLASSREDGAQGRTLVPDSHDSKLAAATQVFSEEPVKLTERTSGTAMVYLLSGTLHALVGEDSMTVGEGDTLTFTLDSAHAVRAVGGPAKALVTIVP